MNRKFTLAMAWTLVAGSVCAHPGHGETDGFTVTHFLTEQTHIAISITVLLTLSGILLWRYRKSITDWIKNLRHA